MIFRSKYKLPCILILGAEKQVESLLSFARTNNIQGINFIKAYSDKHNLQTTKINKHIDLLFVAPSNQEESTFQTKYLSEATRLDIVSVSFDSESQRNKSWQTNHRQITFLKEDRLLVHEIFGIFCHSLLNSSDTEFRLDDLHKLYQNSQGWTKSIASISRSYGNDKGKECMSHTLTKLNGILNNRKILGLLIRITTNPQFSLTQFNSTFEPFDGSTMFSSVTEFIMNTHTNKSSDDKIEILILVGF
ncbi:hypothetical protein [Hydrogenovibrio marinus]|uniref:Uncharacterized protein n=1 Tax=Hydrogenovibrio marinus TaxID=28885 RepID=A0A066ZWB8_HYDMR|nr:hypothetical protein [Hydrogenovibrio marinus]KDN96574.1 hypothetical protein EI16_09980 [Hydrogenovibrio marinus]BBN60218.1 hypothetical protein HVMH_1812 [Hydrogenovibrio marinus]